MVDKAPVTKYGNGVLRAVIGENRANNVLNSISMQVIPKVGNGSMSEVVSDALEKSKSTNNMGNVKTSYLKQLQRNVEKKTKQRGISQYMAGDDESDDEFDISEDAKQDDPSQLCDLELINLLKFCHELQKKHKDTDEHMDEVMDKSLEIGKKLKEKVLILDMDETLIAAKVEGKLPKNFQTSFSFAFQDSSIHVRLRPFLQDALEKLSQIYEIIVFTAGVKEYADPILDKIDPEGTLFRKRLYRDQCIKVDQFYVKDLDIILDREKKNMIIVDNSILSFAFDLANGVPINSFMGDEEDDRDLLYLMAFLDEAFYATDVREACEASFKLQYYLSTTQS